MGSNSMWQSLVKLTPAFFILIGSPAFGQLGEFSAGDPIVAAEMNANFDFLEEEINRLSRQITAQNKKINSLEDQLANQNSGNSGGGNTGNGLGVVVCATAPTSYFGSSSASVIMRNGMEVNNYDGRNWYTSDSHLTFKTATNRWYTIKNQNDYFLLDVIKEPDSCFEPLDDIGRVERVQTVNGKKRIYFPTGSYAVVPTGCEILASAIIAAYETFSAAFLVDLASGRQCQIESIES